MVMVIRTAKGFTIIELLIVIVVIGILAAISVVAYTGVQQRATNSVITSAGSNMNKAMQVYLAQGGDYTSFPVYSCITTTTGCNDGGTTLNSSAAFDAAMATVGTIPRSVPVAHPNYYGMYLTFNTNITYEGDAQPLLLIYYLKGINQNCGSSRVTQYGWPALSASTTGYTTGDVSGTTRCWVSVLCKSGEWCE